MLGGGLNLPTGGGERIIIINAESKKTEFLTGRELIYIILNAIVFKELLKNQ